MSFNPMDLTVAEMSIANRKLGADAFTAIAEGTDQRWQAMAVLAWLHARRADPAVTLESFEALTLRRLAELVGDDEEDTEDDGSDPTAP